jgi:hypothetical protein
MPPAEYAEQQIMSDELKKYDDAVNLKPFTVRPGCLMAWVYLDGFLIIVGIFLYNFKFRLLSFVCVLLAVVFWIAEFMMCKEFI